MLFSALGEGVRQQPASDNRRIHQRVVVGSGEPAQTALVRLARAWVQRAGHGPPAGGRAHLERGGPPLKTFHGGERGGTVMERIGASDLHVGGEIAWRSIGEGVADCHRVVARRLDGPGAHAQSTHLEGFSAAARGAQIAHPLAMVLRLVVAWRPRRHPYQNALTWCRASNDDLDSRNRTPRRLGGDGC